MPDTTLTDAPLSHPKLTAAVRDRFDQLNRQGGLRDARTYLGRALGVSKSQMYLWTSRLLAESPTVELEVFSGPGVGHFASKRSAAVPASLVGRKIRRLFFDIETSPNLVLAWKIGYKLTINHDSLVKERAIICIGYKWEGEKQTHVLRWDENQCDKAMLKEFLTVVNQADEVIGHNLDRFDVPWFKTRCLFHGLPTIPDYKTVDTLQWARRKFYFNSNRLDYIAKFLGLGGKLHTGYDLWKDIVLKNCPKAMQKMTTYCAKDVVLLEQVWKRLSLVVPQKTHVGVLAGGDRWNCPRDGSTNVRASKTRVTAGGTVAHQMQCLDCGGYHTISGTAHSAYLKAKEI